MKITVPFLHFAKKTKAKTIPSYNNISLNIFFSLILVHRALERIGNVHLKQNQLAKALDYFEKSLVEFRSESVLQKANKVCWITLYCFRVMSH